MIFFSRILGDSSQLYSLSIEDPTANSFVLDKLEEFTLYEVILQAFNDVGTSEPSAVVVERTNEAVPGSGPSNVAGNATSSTTILVSWGEIDKVCNGIGWFFIAVVFIYIFFLNFHFSYYFFSQMIFHSYFRIFNFFNF